MEAATPQGDGEYVVVPGDCIASIAAEYGFLPDTLWNHPGNAGLRAGRSDQRVLLPGDRVHIPKIALRYEYGQTTKRHIFRLHLQETLKIVLLDNDGNPRSGLKYTLIINRQFVKSDVTPENGLIEASIPPNAREGRLTVGDDDDGEEYALQLGGLDPVSSITGVQGRLNNLGFYCGVVDGVIGNRTRSALREFQEKQNLTVTGDLDDDTRDALQRAHGL